MTPTYWEEPTPEIDENTATVERMRAEERVVTAESGAQRTHEAVFSLRALVNGVRDMHSENHYVEAMLPFMRGSNRAAS